MNERFNRPLIYGHRGASKYAPENTLAAFRLAVEQGADGIELDAKLTADGEVVVIHDQSVDRTTNGTGLVNRHSLADLKKLDAGFWKDESYSGEKIPTLAEVFEVVGGKVIINIELTNYRSVYDGLAEKVVDLVRRFNLEGTVMFSSFLQANLSAVVKKWPHASVGILALPGLPGLVNRSYFSRWVAPDFLHPYYADVTQRLVNKEKIAGRLLNVWTVNTKDDINRMINWGVEGIITDDPLLALSIREET